MTRRSHSILVGCAACIAANAALVVFCRTRFFLQIVIVMILVLWVAFPLLMGACVLNVFLKQREPILKKLDGDTKGWLHPWLKRGLFLVLIKHIQVTHAAFWGMVAVIVFVCSLIFSLPMGSWLNNYDLAQAKRFCERIGVSLEREREITGDFPRMLDAVLDESGALPHYLRNDRLHYEVGASATLSFPGEFLDIWFYNVETRTWTRD